MDRRIKKALIAIIYLLVWQGAASIVGSPLLLPSPAGTAQALLRLGGTWDFYKSIAFTLVRVTLGFAAGIAAGTLLGAATAFSKAADSFLAPLRNIVKSTPITSIIVLVTLYLASSATPVFIAFLTVAPIAWANVREGLVNADRELVEMAGLFRLTKWKKLRFIYAPAALPGFTAACTTGLGFAWKSGVAAEVIAHPAFSIGRSIYESKLYLEIPDLFAWTAAVVIVSMALERLLLHVLRRTKG